MNIDHAEINLIDLWNRDIGDYIAAFPIEGDILQNPCECRDCEEERSEASGRFQAWVCGRRTDEERDAIDRTIRAAFVRMKGDPP